MAQDGLRLSLTFKDPSPPIEGGPRKLLDFDSAI
jgi:hypothetical protein